MKNNDFSLEVAGRLPIVLFDCQLSSPTWQLLDANGPSKKKQSKKTQQKFLARARECIPTEEKKSKQLKNTRILSFF